MGTSSVWFIPHWEMAVRLLVATVLGGLIGWEREHNNHPAGLRTHILVSVGSCLIMLLSIYGFAAFADEDKVRLDPSRIAAQVVSGIGFLGAGTILRHGFTVSGLTTAASLWVVAAIGLAAGAGFHFSAVVTTVIALVSLELLNRAESFLFRRKRLITMRIDTDKSPGRMGELATAIGAIGIQIRKVTIDHGEVNGNRLQIFFTMKLPGDMELSKLIEAIEDVKGTREVHVE
ncbi:putative Mg2+ transporter-C (MgtC) family protein [Marininema mesophilum]|uniref:Putative Mg2+ transporter-C (MgtC) family protein n=1 Tax=Marininema mesophilum TaxID=1048340 RepID=A0A1H2X716_9BACL|nr:MgtC/SapB family protein [Marininema mesophilum]SDW88591.1 putative Mg2+ transporter-C (MgtC) family protein [Marininema mesophilum]